MCGINMYIKFLSIWSIFCYSHNIIYIMHISFFSGSCSNRYSYNQFFIVLGLLNHLFKTMSI